MTVEQPAIPQKIHAQNTREHEVLLFNKVKEVTGVHDETIIRQACEACKDNNGKVKVEDVVTFLLSDDSFVGVKKKKSSVIPLPPPEACDSRRSQIGKPTSTVDAKGQQSTENQNNSAIQQETGNVPYGPQTKSQAGVIDLTSETGEQDDIQKAIAASLQENTGGAGILGGQVSKEEQDISRVLEQSLAESKAGTKRKRGDLWFVDPLNPHERKRQDGCPVGLKNVGNTCWFSAVIQSLFHLRKFRRLVLNFQVPKDVSQSSQTETRNLRFMQELRYLFALMVGSSKKYVDPSKAVDILKEAFSASAVGVGDAQQDVSEFQHKLLEWLEDAFKYHPSSTPPDGSGGDNTDREDSSQSRNPMVELFYGQYRAEGINEGKGFSNDETFGQFPLQVNGFRDIHESLEAATAQGEIETLSSETNQKSGQELWFTRLPPVLTFELSRFQFNQQLGRPEKIHNKIEFPHIIYMDRYLGRNKTETRRRREQVKKLKEELLVLYAKLDKFNHYGSGSKKVPLQDVLSYALEFAHTKPDNSHVPMSQDVEMASPIKASGSNSSMDNMVTESPSKGDNSLKLPSASPHKFCKTSPVISDPAPRHIEDSELKVLEQCLCRWRTEVEQDVRELQEKISRLEALVNGMYKDALMQRCPYQLHAVLVHEGQAASGHYWAYIYDSQRQEWLKFNDITVCPASWEDLVKESVGGYHNASAYCLMYVDKSHVDDEDSSSSTDMPQQCDLDNLPDDLKLIVLEDNKKFTQEIDDWDREQSLKVMSASTSGGQGSGAGGDGEVTAPTEKNKAPARNSSTVSTQTQVNQAAKLNYSQIHAELSYSETIRIVSDVVELETFRSKGPDVALKLACGTEMKRVEQIVQSLPQKMPREDPRLQYPMVYLKACNVQGKIIDRFLYEQFAYCPLLDKDEGAKQIQQAAEIRIQQQRQQADGSKLEQLCQIHHERYHQFRRVVYYFVKGLQLFGAERYEEALPYLVHAYSQNHTIIAKSTEYSGLQEKLVSFYRRQCMLHINDMVAHQFENSDEISGALHVMNDIVLPCLTMLLSSGHEDDQSAAEEIREKWCAFLGQEIGDKKIEKLQDFLSKLFDPPTESRVTQITSPTIAILKDLYKNYLEMMDVAYRSGYIERALHSK